MTTPYYDEDILEQITSALTHIVPMGNMSTSPTAYIDCKVCVDDVNVWYGDITDIETFTRALREVVVQLNIVGRVTLESHTPRITNTF